jgi:hypothetical protein
MIPTILDIEASGFGRGSYPIEIGFVLPDGKAWCRLIKPEPEWTHWDDTAEEIHHLKRSILNLRGVPVQEVAAELNAALAGETVYCDGWGNDSSWLAMLFYFAGQPQRFRIDTLRTLLSDQQLDLWNDAKREVIRELALDRHRASSDARILQMTFQRTREQALALANAS